MPEAPSNRRRKLALAVGGVLVLGAVLGRRSLSGRAAGGGGGCEGSDYRAASDAGPSRTGTVKQPFIGPLLSGIVGVANVTNLINQQVKYGRQITTGVLYDETLRLETDIATLRSSVSASFNDVLSAITAEQIRTLDSTIEEYWKTRGELLPGKEPLFFAAVRNDQRIDFAALNSLHATLMGDALGSGLIAITTERMLAGVYYTDSDRLGQLVAHLRLVQLRGFGLLNEAFAADAANFLNLDSKRKQVLANLDAQEAAFSTAMEDYNLRAIQKEVSYQERIDPGSGFTRRNSTARSVWRSEPVLRQWNDVSAGFGLDLTPRISVVDATFGTLDVTGTIALKCFRRENCTWQFLQSNIGITSIETRTTPQTLRIEYRCEGIAGTKTVSIDNAEGQSFTLSCSEADRYVGYYQATSETAGNLPYPKWSTTEVTKLNDSTLRWKNGAGVVWQLTLIPNDPSRLQTANCWTGGDGLLVCDAPIIGPDYQIAVERDAGSLVSMTHYRGRFVRAVKP